MTSRFQLAAVCLVLAGLVAFSNDSWAQIGDVDFDGDTDNADLTLIIANYGSVAVFFVGLPGDVDDDGDVDSTDFEIGKAFFSPSGFGQFLPPTAAGGAPAQLIYNPVTGGVQLDQTNAPGGKISTFVLSTAGLFQAPGVASFPFVGSLLEDTSSIIAQTDPNPIPFPIGPPPGFAANPFNLGAILPLGLDLAGLDAALVTSVYVGTAGTGVRAFELVVLPEPASLAMGLISLIGLGWRRR